jgi:hypothetical protein
MNNETKQLLIREVVVPESLGQSNPEWVDDSLERDCPDCDCTLELGYDSENNPKYYCDNCGCAILGPVTLALDDMDITQETEA